MSEYKCLESINSMYIENTELGYTTVPGCLYKDKHRNYVAQI